MSKYKEMKQKVKERTQQIIDEFLKEFGREPTVTELNDRYQALLAEIRRRPKGKATKPQGFATMSPERRAELGRKGGSVKKSKIGDTND